MADPAISYDYIYPFSSEFVSEESGGRLRLAASKIEDKFPYFFEGEILQPNVTAQMLLNLAKIVTTRFYYPPNMLRRIIEERDPVITSGGGFLRFEGFSVCAGAYARVDISPDGYRGEVVGKGTTNVDFNAPTRRELALVRDGSRLTFCVGEEELKLEHEGSSLVERKVELPKRWIKGFVEVQAYQAKMKPRFVLSGQEVLRFLRSLPRNVGSKAEFYVVPTGNGKSLRLSQRADSSGEAVKIAGMKRLNVLADLAPFADRLEVFATDDNQSTEWRIESKSGGISFVLTITADLYRGFSGEGQVLSELASMDGAFEKNLARVYAGLNWQSCIKADSFGSQIGSQIGIDQDSAGRSLATLGSRGLVGYDLNQGGYFHRELPFRIEEVESVHPRLIGARKLIEKGGVKVQGKVDGVLRAEVEGSGVVHIVKIGAGTEAVCTCPWHSKYQGKRGFCKHILAVLMEAEDGE
ncbi:hypothetical protein GC174_06420 [bacterium]|nr:hypothetical protein [bacterium]